MENSLQLQVRTLHRERGMCLYRQPLGSGCWAGSDRHSVTRALAHAHTHAYAYMQSHAHACAHPLWSIPQAFGRDLCAAQAATRSAFLRIDACVGGMDLPPAQCQGAAAMLESLVAQTAAAAAAATTPNETPSPSRMATPLGFADTAAPAQATASSAAAPEHAHSPARDAAAAAARASVGRGAPMSVPPNGAALVCLAAELASVCEGQLQLARACLQWVAMHTLAPQGPGASMSVDAPLFAMGAKVGRLARTHVSLCMHQGPRTCEPAHAFVLVCVSLSVFARGCPLKLRWKPSTCVGMYVCVFVFCVYHACAWNYNLA